uniref:Innate immunity activator n=1 Tax=Latimeria chalumnae TaxID=7897 RepID=H3ARP9_LATCH
IQRDCMTHHLESVMESKDEISDSDSGIILQSGPDSPMPLQKDLTHNMKLRQQVLEERLEACLQELRKLCIREAELTGTLPKEYPVRPGEKPPKVRRRIGAEFQLDNQTIEQTGKDPELSSLERDFALQLQIVQAARRLSQEANISKQFKKKRRSALGKEEKKLQELEETVNEHRIRAGRKPIQSISNTIEEELSASDDSSLSDAVALEDVETLTPVQCSYRHSSPVVSMCPAHPLPPQTLEGLTPTYYQASEVERSPIQNSPWKESSLDQPYEKPKKGSSATSSQSSSPAVTPIVTPSSTPVDPGMGDIRSCLFVPIKNISMHNYNSSSAPSTPELQGRRLRVSQSMRVANDPSQDPSRPRGRSLLPKRRVTNYTATSPESPFLHHPQHFVSNPFYHSSSEDSNSEISSSSFLSSPPNVASSNPGPPSFYRNAHNMSSPNFFQMHSGYIEGNVTPVLCREFEQGRAPLKPSHSAQFPYWEYPEDRTALMMHRVIPSHCRIVRTPSLRDYPNRGLPRGVVSEELKSWHERSKLRSTRPHSLDRQGAIRIRGTQGRESHLKSKIHIKSHKVASQKHVLKRTPEGVPSQWYFPEESEIVSQV